MPPKRILPNIYDLIKRYEAGESIGHLANEVGCDFWTLRRNLTDAGVTIHGIGYPKSKRSEVERSRFLADFNLAERYTNGTTAETLAREIGKDVAFVLWCLRDANVKIRSNSEAQKTRWRTTPDRGELAKRLLSNAWAASTGVPKSQSTKAKIAESKFRSQTGKHTDEDRVATFLEVADFPILQQVPIGSYNVDISIKGFPIAVEVSHLCATDFNRGGCGNRPHRERLKYILNQGWFVIYLIAAWKRMPYGQRPKKKTISLSTIGQDLITWLEHACRNKTPCGHYWVIYGHGDRSSHPHYDFGDNSLVPPPLRPIEFA